MDSQASPDVHIFYRGPEGWDKRDHIIEDGETLCNYSVSVPDVDSLKHFSDVSEAEWRVLQSLHLSNTCQECRTRMDWLDLDIDDHLHELPEFVCPICEEPADSVKLRAYSAKVSHGPEPKTWPPSYEFHEIPRGLYDEWRKGPDDFRLYIVLKEYIDENRELFD